MTLAELKDALDLQVLAGPAGLTRPVTGGYASDLLSDVMANAQAGQVWLTLQGHINVVAVGVLRELAGIILVSGRTPAPDAVAKAEAEGLPLLKSNLPAFELAGRIYQLLKG